jgi:hypothetical protein
MSSAPYNLRLEHERPTVGSYRNGRMAVSPSLGLVAFGEMYSDVQLFRVVPKALRHKNRNEVLAWVGAFHDPTISDRFRMGDNTGLAFGTGEDAGLLFIARSHADHVRVIDVVKDVFVGKVVVSRPRAVAVSGDLVAVLGWVGIGGLCAVRMFSRAATPGQWDPRWTSQHCSYPIALRFALDGASLAVVDGGMDEDDPSTSGVALLCPTDGAFKHDLPCRGLAPTDLEPLGDEGWLVMAGGVAGDDGGLFHVDCQPSGSAWAVWTHHRFGTPNPAFVALFPGEGVFASIGDFAYLVQTPDMARMASMSDSRVAWMGVCARAMQPGAVSGQAQKRSRCVP